MNAIQVTATLVSPIFPISAGGRIDERFWNRCVKSQSEKRNLLPYRLEAPMREDVMAFLRTRIATDTEARRRQTSNSILAVSVPPVRNGRRKAPPVLPSLPGSVPAKKRPS